MNSLAKVILIMMLLLLVRLWLLVHHHYLIYFGVCLVFFGCSFWWAVRGHPWWWDCPASEEVLCLTQVSQGEEVTQGLLRVRWHHPLHRRLPQEEEARLLQQVWLHQPEWLQQQGWQQEVPLQRQEEEVLEGHVLSMCFPERLRLL
jgi:hypothetical protein